MQILKPPTSSRRGAGVVSKERPELALLAFDVLMAWNEVEMSLGFLLGTICQRWTSPDRRSRGSAHPAGMMAMDAMATNYGRFALISEFVELVLPSLLEDWRKARELIRKAGEGRNLIAHSRWATSDELPGLIIRMPTFGELEGWSADDFKPYLERIFKANYVMAEFEGKVCEVLGIKNAM